MGILLPADESRISICAGGLRRIALFLCGEYIGSSSHCFTKEMAHAWFEKTHQIIARTAKFVSEHGEQSKLVLRVKQGVIQFLGS